MAAAAAVVPAQPDGGRSFDRDGTGGIGVSRPNLRQSQMPRGNRELGSASAQVRADHNALEGHPTNIRFSVPRPAEFMLPYFLSDGCTPFTPRTTRCELGNYATYSIEVRSIDDVRAGIRFARTHNIRLVINNSGHE